MFQDSNYYGNWFEEDESLLSKVWKEQESLFETFSATVGNRPI